MLPARDERARADHTRVARALRKSARTFRKHDPAASKAARLPSTVGSLAHNRLSLKEMKALEGMYQDGESQPTNKEEFKAVTALNAALAEVRKLFARA